MAKKKEPVLDDQVKGFQEMMLRTPLKDFLYMNRCLITTHRPKSYQVNQVYTVLVTVGEALWNGLMDDPDWRITVREADIADPEEMELASKAHYSTDDYEWLPIDEKELYDGKVISIHVKGFEYPITVNKWMLPIKLKKVEFNQIDYTVTPDRLLLLRKRFDPLPNIPDTEYAVFRLFRII